MRNLSEPIQWHADTKGSETAIIFGDRRISYATLNLYINRYCAYLKKVGVVPGDIVGLDVGDTPEHVFLLFALTRMCAVILPLDVKWTFAEKSLVVTHFSAKLVITDSPNQPFAAGIGVSQLESQNQDKGHTWPIDHDLSVPFLISLSSGTTGRPKGPLINQEHFFRRFITHWVNLGLNSDSRLLINTPLYFGGGRTFAMSVLVSGGAIHLPEERLAAVDMAAYIQDKGVNSLFLVPTQLRRLLDLSNPGELLLGDLTLLLCSGAPLSPLERRRAVASLCPNFYEYYASTEGGGVSLSGPLARDVHAESVGRPVFGVSVQIVDDDDRPLSTGRIGRLRYTGPGVAQGFLNDPDETRSHFSNGWFYPGDLAEIDQQGFIYLRGRAKDMIISGGINVYPNEIEDVIRGIEGIVDVAVVGIPDADLGERVVCAWVGVDGLGEEVVRDKCKERLASYKVPKQWSKRTNLPMNSSGKVLKREIQSFFGDAGYQPGPARV